MQDIKVRKIMSACGIQSVTILISLLSSIYRDEGYYVGWDSDMSFLVADEVGTSEGAVLEVVNKAIQVDFFNKDLFEKYKILTSKGIQKRYIEAIQRRKTIELIAEYLLLDFSNDYKNIVNVNIYSINVNRSTQSKVKESKVKKSKVINIAKNSQNSQKYGEFENVVLSDEEYKKLQERFSDYQVRIENLSGYIASTGKKYKSHYATILNWARKDEKTDKSKSVKNTAAYDLDKFKEKARGPLEYKRRNC